MKVPQYRSQTALPKQTGAGTLSVQASPSAMGMVGAAQQEFGQNLATEGLRWGEHFLKVERATEQAGLEKEFYKTILQTETNAYTQPPETWRDPNDPNKFMGYFDRSKKIRDDLISASNKQLLGIKDKAVKMRMAASNQQTIAAAMTRINAGLRPQYLSWAKAQIKAREEQSFQSIAMMPEGPAKEEAIKTAKANMAYWQTLVPFLGDEYLYNRREKFDETIGSLAIRRKIDDITTSDEAQDWIAKLDDPPRRDPDYGNIIRMGDTARQRMVERLQKTRATLMSRENSEAERRITRDETTRKRTQLHTFESVNERITKVRVAKIAGHAPGDSQWPKDTNGNDLKEVTVGEIANLGRDVTQDNRNVLVKNLTGEDVIFNRPQYVEYSQQIFDAVTDDDLNKIEGHFRSDYSTGIIGAMAYEKLKGELKGRRTLTPEYKETQKYDGLLRKAISSTAMKGAALAVHQKEDLGSDASHAGSIGRAYFFDQIANGVRPVKAFYQTIARYANDRQRVAENIYKAFDSNIRNGVSKTTASDINKITPDEVQTMRNNFKAALRNQLPKGVTMQTPQVELGQRQRSPVEELRITKDQRLTVRRLFTIETQLNYLDVFAQAQAKLKTLVDSENPDESSESLFEKAFNSVSGFFTNENQRRDRSSE